jgi:hypothetical protein
MVEVLVRVLVKIQSKSRNWSQKGLVLRFVCEKMIFPMRSSIVLAPLGPVDHVESCTKALSKVLNATFKPKCFGSQFGVTFGTSK